jgi:hypothetical protein
MKGPLNTLAASRHRALLVVLGWLCIAPATAAVVYVDKNAPAVPHDGKAWGTAFTAVTAGVNAAASGDEVWVAKGTYLENNITPPSGVALYGGFAGTETARTQRDSVANPTVLDGGGSVSPVVACSFQGIAVDGFTIRKGGRGVSIDGEANVSNTIFSGNYTAVYVDFSGKATVSNSTISGNDYNGVDVSGGEAMLSDNSIFGNANVGIKVTFGTVTLSNNTIAGNQYAGVDSSTSTVTLSGNRITSNGTDGVSVSGGAATLSSNIISGNVSHGVYSYFGTATLSNNVISGNPTNGVSILGGKATLSNNTVCGNGSGVTVDGSGTAFLSNNIVAFNDDGVSKTTSAAISTFSHNDVYGNSSGDYSGYAVPSGQGNISVDPLFVRRSDYHLQSGSPCIDAGDNAAVVDETDADGQPRRTNDPATPDTGAGVSPIVDIGAYEYVAVIQPLTAQDVMKALQVAGGLSTATGEDAAHLSVIADGGVNVLDAVRIARKVAGLEANP